MDYELFFKVADVSKQFILADRKQLLELLENQGINSLKNKLIKDMNNNFDYSNNNQLVEVPSNSPENSIKLISKDNVFTLCVNKKYTDYIDNNKKVIFEIKIQSGRFQIMQSEKGTVKAWFDKSGRLRLNIPVAIAKKYKLNHGDIFQVTKYKGLNLVHQLPKRK